MFAGISGIISEARENVRLETVLRIVIKEAPVGVDLKNTGVIEKAKRPKFIILDRNNLMAKEIKSENMDNEF